MKLKFLVSCSIAAFAAVSAPAQAQTEIQWWHAMGGPLGEWVNDLAKDFNESQKDYKVVPTFKGTYDESMPAAIAAYRAGNAPNILQVYEVGTATMMASKGAIVPVWQDHEGRRQEVRHHDLRAGRRRLLHRAERADAEPSVQQLDHRLLLQQGRLQGRRPRPEQAADHLARSRLAAAKLKASGAQVPVHHVVAGLDAARELLGLAQRRVRDQE